jgi:hypothetical protein
MAVITPYLNDYLESESQIETGKEWVGVDVNPSNTIEYIPVIYGIRKVEGIRLFTTVDPADSTKLYCVYALSEGNCRSVNAIYINDKKLTLDYTTLTHRRIINSTQAGGPSQIEFVDGRGSAATLSDYFNSLQGPSTLLSQIGITRNYKNLCYIVMKFDYATTNFNEVPKVGVELWGRRINEFTGAGVNINYTWTQNPAMVVWDLLNHSLYGKNQSQAKIDKTSFTSVVDYCDALITSGTTSYKRFTCNWIMDTSQSLSDNLLLLLQTYKFALIFKAGKFYLFSEGNATGSGLLFSDNIIGDVSIQYPDTSVKYNKVFVEYPEYSNYYQTRSEQFPADDVTTFLTEDGNIVLENRITCDTVTDVFHASDLAQMNLRKSRGQLTYRFKITDPDLTFEVGTKATLALTYPNINQEVYITQRTINEDFTVDIEAVLWSSGFYPGSFSNVIKEEALGSSFFVPGLTGASPAIIGEPVYNTGQPPAEPLYAVSSNASIFNEGQNIVFNIATAGVANGTVIKWEIVSTRRSDGTSLADVSSDDITNGVTSGTVTIQSGQASQTISIRNDLSTNEYEEIWDFNLRSNTTNALLTSCTVTVKDTSQQAGSEFAVTLANVPTLTDNSNFYLGGQSGSGYDTQEFSSNGVNVGYTAFVSKIPYNSAGNWYSAALLVKFGLIDRLRVSRRTIKRIFFVYENQTAITATPTSPRNTYRKTGTTGQEAVYQFNLQNPPADRKATQLTSLFGSEKDFISATGINPALPALSYPTGAPRLVINPNVTGNYISGSGAYGVIYIPISYKNNSSIKPKFEGVYNTDFALTDVNNIDLKVTFFELDILTNQITTLGFKVFNFSLTTSCITTKYLALSRTNLTSLVGGSAPF